MSADGPILGKYYVSRVDGAEDDPASKHCGGCDTFVLDLDHDPYARHALHAYAAACEGTHPTLAADILRRYPLWWHVYGAIAPAGHWLMMTLGESTKHPDDMPAHHRMPDPLSDGDVVDLAHLASFDYEPDDDDTESLTPESHRHHEDDCTCDLDAELYESELP